MKMRRMVVESVAAETGEVRRADGEGEKMGP